MTVRTLCRWTAWLLAGVVVFVTLSPIELRPIITAPAYLERFAAFAVMGGAFGLGYPRHRLRILLGVLLFVGLLEVAQHIVPGRHGRLADGSVKAVGILVGMAVALAAGR